MKTCILVAGFILGVAGMAWGGARGERSVLFAREKIRVLLAEDAGAQDFLTGVSIHSPAGFTPASYERMDEKVFRKVEFVMQYSYSHETERGQQVFSCVTYFIPNGANYKIYGSSYLSDWWRRENKDQPFAIQMSFEATLPKTIYIGTSDDEKLLAVKVWKYAKELWKK